MITFIGSFLNVLINYHGFSAVYSKTCLKRSLKEKTKIGFQDRLSLKETKSVTMNIFFQKKNIFF